jgi:hypothetical protein
MNMAEKYWGSITPRADWSYCGRSVFRVFIHSRNTMYWKVDSCVSSFEDEPITDVGKQHALYQYSETNVMHLLFSLLRIKSFYMFRALLAHPQDTPHKRHLVCCVRVMLVGCTRIEVGLVQPTDITRTQYTKYCLCSASLGWGSNARNIWAGR